MAIIKNLKGLIMRINKVFLYASACILFPIFSYAMQMDSNAPSLRYVDESTKIGECFDNGLMCACGPCFHAGTFMSKKISKCCSGVELSMPASCQGCSCCSMQLLFWALLIKGEMRPEVGHPDVADVCAISAGGTACLAYLAHRLERFQAKRNALAEQAASDELVHADHLKAE